MAVKKSAAAKIQHPWSSSALLAKAQRYAQEMASYASDDWHFGVNSTFVLEFLARAALAHVSPTLLADGKDWTHLYFALGHAPKVIKYIPHSINTKAVLLRLSDILPEFTPEQVGFAQQHISRRNEELHSGGTPFDSVKPTWLAPFYLTCKILLVFLGEDLAVLFGTDAAKVAEALIEASLDQSAKTVMKAVAAHKASWSAKAAQDRKKSARQASLWATRQAGHRVKCPACENDALVSGPPVSEAIRKLKDDLIIEIQEHLPANFECIACLLKISGLSQLNALDLSTPYKSTSTFSAAEFYALDDQYAGFDDDNNEY
jgi:hypothetical protein